MKVGLDLTDEKQRERTETTWVMMASGLHIWSQFPPLYIWASLGAGPDRAAISQESGFVPSDLLRLERANGQALFSKTR